MAMSEPAALRAETSVSGRMLFLDAVRGAALIWMVVNHTARFWMDGSMRWGRYHGKLWQEIKQFSRRRPWQLSRNPSTSSSA